LWRIHQSPFPFVEVSRVNSAGSKQGSIIRHR
jgi:hypothetical protein